MKFRTFSVVFAWLVTLSAASSAAQTNMARLMGVITDGSGGALPGVTVTVSAANKTVVTVFTDGNGRYLTGWLSPGTYDVTFELSGFESRRASAVAFSAGQTIVFDLQLPLATLTETVQVTAPAPPPPLPPPPVYVPRPRPVLGPVDPEVLASVCGPRQATNFSQAIGKIVSHSDNIDRQLMGPGDRLRLDVGEKQGVAKGQNLVVRRKFQTGERLAAKKDATYAEQSAGLVQIIEIEPDASTAQVVYLCGEIYAGDTVEPFISQPAYFAISDGPPRFDEAASITTGAEGRELAAAGDLMVIDHGVMQGAARGQRVTIFRKRNAVPFTVGEGTVISVRADSATIRIERVVDAVMVGDKVALHR